MTDAREAAIADLHREIAALEQSLAGFVQAVRNDEARLTAAKRRLENLKAMEDER